MKTMYIDCHMGAAGDMISAALLELVTDKKGIVDQLNAIGIPGVKYVAEQSVKCGITGTHLKVQVNGIVEGEHEHSHNHEHSHEHIHSHEHEHEHDHEHSHTHHHSSMHDIEHIVRGHMTLPAKVADDVMEIYKIIAQAESHAHGVPVTDIHFHEVGTMDAIADITAVCLLMYIIAPEKVVVSPIHVGHGQVKCAHGILPVPAPATAFILKNVPIYGGEIEGELCTPTGAALIKYFANDFGTMPAMKTDAIGYGMGTKDFASANCVRITLGESVEGVTTMNIACGHEQAGETVVELECNVDDMTGEEIGFAINALLQEGALEAFAIPVIMKKSRPGHLLTVLAKDKDIDHVVKMIFKNTTTIGIRKSVRERYTLDREVKIVHTQYGDVREKVSSGYGVVRRKYEYDDVADIAQKHEKSYMEVVDIIRESN